ncbi:coatomer alpha subunit, putative [Plasmodium knowlesi strain H]|uniref:Coatomer alpha subunit, putative n=2 Tax=Plasmodium knowlesi TaxID=5850 RepID=A0A679L3D1_PLAKH|nr:coatomer alpha subunit, putative [Plasmodium knowlesi strain H]OTN64585.1 putative Coatomer alpha subunit [Plasmodium knowlesi]CAA9989261.1 coatomer alpha subunit, putative [Plasmodium knowlesi strain H]VVS78735.1 coatomer alpha subunit, putative [Plasmodium knowlesi strain H]
MLVKCETKSQRVKSISFHPKINLILAGLHNGIIQLWDYRIGILIDKFEEHEGPVRGIDFHTVQPLFVSGADDYLIKVWNIHLKKCVFNLVGHLDYIRKVQFHLTYPWILSASDDQTIRIWNWQSRVCIAILTGHNHYVMCAEFHPTQDLIISSSLDKTLRVWDIKLLREKNVILTNENVMNDLPYGLSKGIYNQDVVGTVGDNQMGMHSFVTNNQQLQHLQQQQNNNNMFGASDAICKFVLEGHEKGVNCCAFHHSLPIIASGSDDKLVKLWRYNDNKCWELDTLRGHFNNVSSLVFHQSNDDLLLSNSEDRTIRIWDISKRACIHTFRRENDRFWILSFKPNSNLIASGHDSGMVIFKFEKEKCPFDKYGTLLLYVKEKRIYAYDVRNNKHTCLCPVRKNGNAMVSGYYKLLYNQFCTTHVMLLFVYKEEDHYSFDLIICDTVGESSGAGRAVSASPPASPSTPSALHFFKSWARGASGNNANVSPQRNIQAVRNPEEFNPDSVKYLIKNKHCSSVAFYTRNKYLLVEKRSGNYLLSIQNIPEDNTSKRVEVPFKVEAVYPLNNNKVIILSESKIYLYDISLKKILNEMNHTDSIISVEILKDHNIAFVFKYNVVLTTIDLVHLCTVHEYIRVKSGVWDEENKNVFIYNTLSHLKYILINGEKGLIKCLEEPVYLFKIYNNRLFYITRKQDVISEPLNDTEYLFKLSLANNDEHSAYHYLDIQHKGNTFANGPHNEGKKKLYFSYNLIGYIKKKGFANLAVQMVNNNHTLFNLSIQLGHLNNALKAAKKINKKHIWNLLSVHALLLGSYDIAEYALLRMKAYDKLSFLYLFSGNIEKLKKMQTISIIRADLISMFLNSLYLGDIQQRINIFVQQNQVNLAWACSQLYDIPINLSEKNLDFDINECSYCPEKSFYLCPPIPIVRIDPNAAQKKNTSTEESTEQMRVGKEAQNGPSLKDAPPKWGIPSAWNGSYNWPVINLEKTFQPRDDPSASAPQWSKKKGPVKSDQRSNASEADDVWKDEVNDEDIINIDLDLEDHKDILSKSAATPTGSTKIERVDNLYEIMAKKYGRIMDHIRTGNIKSALDLISKKYGIVDMKPLKTIIKNVYISTYAYLTPMPNFAPMKIPINSNEDATNTNVYINEHFLFNQIKKAHKLVTLGKFCSALDLFRSSLYHMIFITPGDKDREMNEYLHMCTSYILAMRLEEERNTTATEDPRRSLELMAYFTCCPMQNSHLYLVLRRGMGLAWKAQNYVTAGSFAKRLINGNYESIKGSEEEIVKAKKILLMCEQKSTEQYNIDYDPNDYHNMRVCSVSLTRIKPNEETVSCPFCQSVSKREYTSKMCPNCLIAHLGKKALGFDFLNKNA